VTQVNPEDITSTNKFILYLEHPTDRGFYIRACRYVDQPSVDFAIDLTFSMKDFTMDAEKKISNLDKEYWPYDKSSKASCHVLSMRGFNQLRITNLKGK
jgi:hypothetical protein